MTETDLKHVVWIDTDPSVARGGCEIDDGLALIQAFNSPELDIRGISTVFGNASLDRTDAIGREIVNRFGPKGLNVYSGASGSQDLGIPTSASEAITSALDTELLTIIALGPVTNIATVVADRPDLTPNIRQVVAVAGRRPGQRFLSGPGQPRSFPDLNFELDAEAFRVLLEARIPLVLAPWELSSRVWLTEAEVESLKSGGEAARWIYEPAVDWLAWWRDALGLDGFNPFDTLAIGYVTSPQFLIWENLRAEIVILPNDVDAMQPGDEVAVKPFLHVGREIESSYKVRYCYDVAGEFREDLMKRLLH
ncbi:MAG: nucleoside hydrolase [Acidobacteria bacterium]|nr:nucleoside hydrolase [Acidobacteriota bacterium]MCW5970092.1 nucleoside hydrolase [Blastocatellales bacterium]